jgi:hypothetical protein
MSTEGGLERKSDGYYQQKMVTDLMAGGIFLRDEERPIF